MAYDRKRADPHRTNHKRCPECRRLRRYRDHNEHPQVPGGQWEIVAGVLICPKCVKETTA